MHLHGAAREPAGFLTACWFVLPPQHNLHSVLMLCALSLAGAALVPGSSRPAVSTRSVTFGRRDMAVVAAAAFAGVAMPAFADEAADKKAEEKAAEKKAAKGPPPNLGGPMAATQKSALGIVSDSQMPQFRGSKGAPIPPFKVAALGKLDPKVRRARVYTRAPGAVHGSTRAPSPGPLTSAQLHRLTLSITSRHNSAPGRPAHVQQVDIC